MPRILRRRRRIKSSRRILKVFSATDTNISSIAPMPAFPEKPKKDAPPKKNKKICENLKPGKKSFCF